jgi:hypothetical protein
MYAKYYWYRLSIVVSELAAIANEQYCIYLDAARGPFCFYALESDELGGTMTRKDDANDEDRASSLFA